MSSNTKSHQLNDRVQIGHYFLHFAALSGRFNRGQEFERLRLVSDGWAAAVLLHHVYQRKLKDDFKLVGKLLTEKIVSPRDLLLESIAMAKPESKEDAKHALAFYDAVGDYWEALCLATQQIGTRHLVAEIKRGLSHEVPTVARLESLYVQPLEEEHINDSEKVLVKVMKPVAFSTSRLGDFTFGFSRSVVRQDPRGEDAILDPSLFFASRLYRLSDLMQHENGKKHGAYQVILQMTLYFVSLPSKKTNQPTYREDADEMRQACDNHGCRRFGREEYQLHRKFFEDNEQELMELFQGAAVWWCEDFMDQALELGKVGLEMKKWLYALYDVKENVHPHPHHHSQQSLARSRLARSEPTRDAFSVVSRRDL